MMFAFCRSFSLVFVVCLIYCCCARVEGGNTFDLPLQVSTENGIVEGFLDAVSLLLLPFSLFSPSTSQSFPLHLLPSPSSSSSSSSSFFLFLHPPLPLLLLFLPFSFSSLLFSSSLYHSLIFILIPWSSCCRVKDGLPTPFLVFLLQLLQLEICALLLLFLLQTTLS
jgi:hypothetical protein